MKKSRIKSYSFYDLENSEKHQVNGDFFDATERTLRAARETAGIVLTDRSGKLIPAFFHASCGGRTLRPDEVWTNRIHGYVGANCDYCKKKENWQNVLTRPRFKIFLDWLISKKYIKNIKTDGEVIIYPDNKSNKLVALSIDKKRLKLRKSHFRRYFGRVMFPSNNFYITSGLVRGNVSVVGKGNGHGVGMCQIGSKGLAHKGKGHKQILAHYYPKFNLKKFY